MWPEVQKAKQENRHELVLGGNEINKRISDENNQLDQEIFNLTSLNFLDIHETSLEIIPDNISNLKQLQSLVLNGNKLKIFNLNICKLDKLKLLDLSRNCLKEIPVEIDNLSNIVTLNFNYNQLETFPKLSKTNKLTIINLSNNKLKFFPDLFDINGISEIKLNDNEIEYIPQDINKLSFLKNLEINHNKIKIIPGEIADCNKLKVVDLKDNPISDRRLLKLIDQCRTKQIIDYVKAHSPKSTITKTKTEQTTTIIKEQQENHKYTVRIHYANEENPKIIIDESVKNVREYFVGCLIRNIEFTPETFKKFIQIQNKLHETVCGKRNLATLATHDFNKLPAGNLVYTTQNPTELKIQPLNRTQIMSGAELATRLLNEANNLRKEKKRNTYSGIHKYLYLIEGQSKYPCLLNSTGIVISFPPITNSDCTKITIDTNTILIEVTSSESLQICKTTIEHLIKEMLLSLNIFNTNHLIIDQIKTVDKDGNLKVVFPSKTDLVFDSSTGIKVIRD